jgi:NAD(P)-dependent dehydrogenase (short-subunit alcohol dehydrogenase family)
VILGGSSGFGLATAHRLAAQGMSLCLVHRDRRSVLRAVEPEFEKLRGHGVPVLTFNRDALDAAEREALVDALASALGAEGRVRLLLHSIAFGSLKLLAPERRRGGDAAAALAARLGLPRERVAEAANALLAEGCDGIHALADPPGYPGRYLDDEDFRHTVHAMGTSLVGWTQALLARGLFADDARVLGLTSEGSAVAWKGYAAVAAAKCALEAAGRALAVELAPYGLRTNLLQPGVTDTPALRAIPGAEHLLAQARLRNPFGRLTTPRDVASVIALLCSDEAAWINGCVIRVDGGEHISGVGA